MKNQISIYIIESYNLTRNLYKRSFCNEFEIKGEFKDETKCYEAFIKSPSDIILMDLKLPYEKSFNFIEKIKTTYPDTKIIILTTVEDEEIMYAALAIGVSGYLLKDINISVLKDTIKQIHTGKLYFQTQEEVTTLT